MFHVKFADIGEGIHEGVLLKNFFEPGDSVSEGDTLFTLETDKVNAEIPSPVTGKLAQNNYVVGDAVQVGQVIVVVDDGQPGVRSNMPDDFDQTERVEEAGSTSVVGQIEVSSDVIEASTEGNSVAEANVTTGKVLATPVARKMAKDLGLDITKIHGTGPQGRVMKSDIQKASQPKTLEKDHVREPYEENHAIDRIPMTMLRKTISKNMTLSKYTIPHTAVMDEADATDLVAFRSRVKEMAAEKGVKLTYLAFFVKAVVAGLKAFPYLNASLDDEKDEILLKRFYNIGIAVDTEDGLMVPVIRNADRLSIFEVAEVIEDLSNRARQKALKLDELSDGTFTITNYGAVGASFGVPIIKHPEAGILGVGAIVKKPVVIEEEIVIREILPLSLSFDHRIIDGADAGRFVALVKSYVANPEMLLLNS